MFPLHTGARAGEQVAFEWGDIDWHNKLVTVGVAKACSFVVNLVTLPLLYLFGRRRFSKEVGLGAMAVLAILPVHAIYAGFVLRESLVALTALLAVWTLTEAWSTPAGSPRVWGWAALAGLCGGLAILARNTGLAMHRRRRPARPFSPRPRTHRCVLALGGSGAARHPTLGHGNHFSEYGTPFYSYTSYFEYNFSWTVHHFDKGNTRAEQFYTLANAPEIVRVKFKSLLIIVVYSTMIVGLPLVAGFAARLIHGPADQPGRDVDLLAATVLAVFVLATLKSIPDVTQIAQLGRYYLPVYLLAIPTAVAGVFAWIDRQRIGRRAWTWLAASFIVLVWADPTWAYDASWLVKPYQLHWPALRAAGDWIKSHPDRVPHGCADHDVAALGVTHCQRPHHCPPAAQLQPAANRRGDPAIRGHTLALGFLRPSAPRRSRDLGLLSGPAPRDVGSDLGTRTLPFAAGCSVLPGAALPDSLRASA